jgi:hypothetical protein
MPIDVDRELSISIGEAERLKICAKELFWGFSLSPDVADGYKRADFLLEVVGVADALHADEIKSNTADAYYWAARGLEENLWDFIWDTPKILKEALDDACPRSRFRTRRRDIAKQIVLLRRDIDCGSFGIGSIGLQYRALLLSIKKLSSRQKQHKEGR